MAGASPLDRAIARGRRAAWWMTTMLRVRIVGMLIGSIGWNLYLLATDVSRAGQAGPLLSLAFAVGGAWMVMRAMKRWQSPPAGVPLPVEAGAEVARLVTELCRHLEVDESRLRIWLLPAAGDAIPSVSVSRAGQVELVLPLGFLHIARTDRPAAAAMLAHELAHVLNDDATKLSLSMATADVLKPWILLHFVLAGWCLFKGDGVAVLSLGAYIVAGSAFVYSMERAARDAEDNADLVAAATVGFAPLARAIERYCRPARLRGTPDGPHRKSADRIARLERLQRELGHAEAS